MAKKALVPEGMRCCTKCKSIKDENTVNFGEFKRGRNGLNPLCRVCAHDRAKSYPRSPDTPEMKENRRLRHIVKKAAKPLLAEKKCGYCFIVLPIDNFELITKSDGNKAIHKNCKVCAESNAKRKKLRQKNRVNKYQNNVREKLRLLRLQAELLKPRPKEGCSFCLKCGNEKEFDIVNFAKHTTKKGFLQRTCRICTNKPYVVEKRILQNPNILKLFNSVRAIPRAMIKGRIKYSKRLQCDADTLKKHLKRYFRSGMNWSNYGYEGWHIDHYYPLSEAYKLGEEFFKLAVSYHNLRPAWADDNYVKRAKIPKEFENPEDFIKFINDQKLAASSF